MHFKTSSTNFWTLLIEPTPMIKNNKEEGGKPLIGTKAFTVINQIYIQFIQMFNLQQKYKKKKKHFTRCKIRKQVHWRHHWSTKDRQEGSHKEQKGNLGKPHRKKRMNSAWAGRLRSWSPQPSPLCPRCLGAPFGLGRLVTFSRCARCLLFVDAK